MRSLLFILPLVGCGSNQGVAVVNSPPTASISSPTDGTSVLAGTSVELRGAVSDTNHSANELQVTWFAGERVACVAGPPGSDGTTLCNTPLLETEGEIRLEVADPTGAIASDSITLQIYGSTPPSAEILEPTGDETFYADVGVPLVGLHHDRLP